MNLVDWILLAVILAITATASWFVRKARKSGKKCIGCPDSCACSGNNCSGGCQNCQDK